MQLDVAGQVCFADLRKHSHFASKAMASTRKASCRSRRIRLSKDGTPYMEILSDTHFTRIFVKHPQATQISTDAAKVANRGYEIMLRVELSASKPKATLPKQHVQNCGFGSVSPVTVKGPRMWEVLRALPRRIEISPDRPLMLNPICQVLIDQTSAWFLVFYMSRSDEEPLRRSALRFVGPNTCRGIKSPEALATTAWAGHAYKQSLPRLHAPRKGRGAAGPRLRHFRRGPAGHLIDLHLRSPALDQPRTRVIATAPPAGPL